jgi:ribosomal protein S18 acetylase RimI-like enzyme
MDLEIREIKMQEAWRHVHGDKPMPTDLLSMRTWECVHLSGVVGHCIANTATGEILGLSVDPGFRRQGIARKLLAHIVDLLRSEGAQRIWLAAPCDSTLPAHRFYRALGWRPTGERLASGDEILEFPVAAY